MVKDFFSLPEAAAELGISRIAVFKKVRKGRLDAVRIGRNWAIAASVLASYRGRPAPPLPAVAQPPGNRVAQPVSPAFSDKEMKDMGWD